MYFRLLNKIEMLVIGSCKISLYKFGRDRSPNVCMRDHHSSRRYIEVRLKFQSISKSGFLSAKHLSFVICFTGLHAPKRIMRWKWVR